MHFCCNDGMNSANFVANFPANLKQVVRPFYNFLNHLSLFFFTTVLTAVFFATLFFVSLLTAFFFATLFFVSLLTTVFLAAFVAGFLIFSRATDSASACAST